MNRVATAEPPHADHAADESRTAHAIPLPDPLPTIPLGDEGIAWQGESRIVRELLAERSAAVEGTASGRPSDDRQIGAAPCGLSGEALLRDRFSQAFQSC